MKCNVAQSVDGDSFFASQKMNAVYRPRYF